MNEKTGRKNVDITGKMSKEKMNFRTQRHIWPKSVTKVLHLDDLCKYFL